MNQVVKVHLTKLYLWMEPARFQAWPEILLRLDPGVVYTSTAAVAQAALGFQAAEDGHIKFDEAVFNLPGWSSNRRGEPILRGVGLLEKRNHGYVLSEAGEKLASLYRSNPGACEWKAFLAGLLLSREPRTRVMMQLLVQPDAELRFSKPHWFGGLYREATLESCGLVLHPFPPKSVKDTPFHHHIQSRASWALGEWRSEAAIRGAGQVLFMGAGDGPFSLHDIGLSLRGSLELFLNIGLVAEADGRVTWQAARAAELLSPELLTDLGAPLPPRESPEQIILRCIAELAGDDGFLVFSDLRRRALAAGITGPDKLVDDMVRAGSINLIAHDFGQPVHGDGLLGDPRKQLVKFAVHQNAAVT